MIKRLIPFLILFICAQAEAKIFIKPFDSIGVRASGDLTVPCPSGQIMKSSGSGVWACAADATGAGGATFTTKENDSIITATTGTLDFGAMLDGTESPSGEVNVSVDLTEATSANGTLPIGNGGTGVTSISDDAVLVGNSGASGFDKPALPSCSNSTTSKLLYNSTNNAFSCGTDQDTFPTGTGFAHINAGVQDAAARAVNLASADVTGTLAVGNGGTGATSLNDLIALTTHTTGNYVTSVGTTSPLSGGAAGSEGAAISLTITKAQGPATDGYMPGAAMASIDAIVPISADTFITQANVSNLSAERALAAGNAVRLTDGGANSSMTVSWDTVTVSNDALSATTVTPSGFEVISGRATLLQGCANNQALIWDETNDVWRCTTPTGTPSGSDKQVQFNDGGSAFGVDSGLTFDKTSDNLGVSGDAIVVGTGRFGSAPTSTAAAIIAAPPNVETITAAATITADGCGTLKRITATGAVTTNTTNTFTAPATSNSGCVMTVVNTGSNNITLDNNANFKSSGAADVVLTSDDAVIVASTGSVWYQITALEAN